ncbi:AI-2E family transporter [Halalkalirubrum salinum]|uniref:AI-2E family transporter n=1 Tax=Halalkalirubrum salinum TaxID=2563889 RepID=UPI0010FB575F|nr:AI-2E family transporter [Halalkalirubrum salinum]
MTALRRNDVFWWLYVVALVAAALYIAYSFVGILVLGLFGYYAIRPICTRFQTVIESKSLAAALTVSIVLVPVLVLSFYAGFRVFQQLEPLLGERTVSMLTSQFPWLDALQGSTGGDFTSLLQNPPSLEQVTNVLFGSALQTGLDIVDVILGALLLVALAATLSYALLVYDEAIATAFATLAGDRETTVYSYARAVDSDLESIFFGNFLFILVMSVIATATYAATNLIVSPEMQIPMVFTLGVLTGVASLIPLVVGKIIYLPVIGYLAVAAVQQGSGQLLFVGGLLAVYVFVLDILPQSFLQPYISGRQINAILLLFAYILGPILFGWYGFFFLPIVFVLILEATRIVLPALLHGEAIDPDPDIATETGAKSEEIREDTPTDETAAEADEADSA